MFFKNLSNHSLLKKRSSFFSEKLISNIKKNKFITRYNKKNKVKTIYKKSKKLNKNNKTNKAIIKYKKKKNLYFKHRDIFFKKYY